MVPTRLPSSITGAWTWTPVRPLNWIAVPAAPAESIAQACRRSDEEPLSGPKLTSASNLPPASYSAAARMSGSACSAASALRASAALVDFSNPPLVSPTALTRISSCSAWLPRRVSTSPEAYMAPAISTATAAAYTTITRSFARKVKLLSHCITGWRPPAAYWQPPVPC